jgi:hypothetical protein
VTDQPPVDTFVGAWIDLCTPYTGEPVNPRPPACDMVSPGGRMLCLLPYSYGLAHHHGQHLGLDRNGCFRGWADKR